VSLALLVSAASRSPGVAAQQRLAPQDEATPSRREPIDQAHLERLSEELRPAIEELRGASFKRPVRVELADRERFRSYVAKRVDESSTREQRAADELIRKLLGMIPPEMDAERVQLDFLEQQVGGYYDPAEDAFYLMQGLSGGVARVILAHELVHALDDQLHDIDATKKRLPRDFDAQLAYHGVVEGNATGLMNRWMMRQLGSLTADDMDALRELSAAGPKDAPEVLFVPTLASYLCGASFLVRSDNVATSQMKAAAVADIERAFREPPRSSEQLLHPEKYWDEAKRDDPRTLELRAADLPDGWKLLREDVIGELEWALALRAPADRRGFDASNALALLKRPYTSQAATGWGGSRAALFAQGESLALCVRSVWDSEQDAQEFDEALRARLPELAAAAQALAQQRGFSPMLAGVELGAGTSAEERELWCWVGVEAPRFSAVRARVSWLVTSSTQENVRDAEGDADRDS